MSEAYKQAVSWRDSWNTQDEIRFVFGGPFYRGLLRADMVRINRVRSNYGMPPTTREKMIDEYTRNLYTRRWDPRVDPHEVGRAVMAKMIGGSADRA